METSSWTGSHSEASTPMLAVRLLTLGLVLWPSSIPVLATSPVHNFSLALVVPSQDNPVYQQALAGATLAARDLRSTGPLRNSTCGLDIHPIESQYSSWNAIARLSEAIQTSSTMVAVAGLVSSSEVRATTPLTTATDMVALTTAATDSGLTKGVAPNLLRVCPSDHNLATVLSELVLLYSWSEFALLHSDEFYGEKSRLQISQVAALRNIAVSSVSNIQYSGRTPSARTFATLNALKRSGTKIIVCNLPVDHLLPVLRAAKQLGMLAPTYVWIGTHLTVGMGLLDTELVGLLHGTLWMRPEIDKSKESAFMQKLASSGVQPSPTAKKMFSRGSMYAYDAATIVGGAVAKCCEGPRASRRTSQQTLASFGNLALQSQTDSACVLDQLRRLTFTSSTGTSVSFRSQGNLLLDQAPVNYEVVNVVGNETKAVAKWSHLDRLVSFSNPVIIWPGGSTEVPSGKTVFKGVLKVLVPISKPFSFIPGTSSWELEGGSSLGIPDYGLTNGNFSGVAVDLLREVARRTGFEYTLHLYPYGSWTDMVALVGNESSPWDLAIGSITVTKERSQTANFTRSMYLSGLQMLVLRPTNVVTSVWSFILPLHWHLWLVLLLMLLVVAGIMICLDRRGVSFRASKGLPISDSIFFSFSSFFFVHESDNLEKPMGRVFISVVMFAVLILGAAYTAQLSFYLSTRKGSEPVKDIGDLYSVWVGCRFGGANYPYVTGELGLRKVRVVSGRADMLGALRNGSISAYIADIPHIEAIAGIECDTMTTGRRVYTQQYAFAAKTNAVWLGEMNRVISVLLNEGAVTRFYQQYVPNSCPPIVSIDTIKPLTITDLLSLIYLVAMATGIAALGKCFYAAVIRPRRKRSARINDSGRHKVQHGDGSTSSTFAYSSEGRDSGVSDTSMLDTPQSTMLQENFDAMNRSAAFSENIVRIPLMPMSTSSRPSSHRSTMDLFVSHPTSS